MNTLKDLDLKDKTVFYRTDYNVPLKNGKILDDFRITSSFATLDYLIAQNAKIIIGTHIGKPKGEVVPALDTKIIAQRLADQYPERVIRLARRTSGDEVEMAIGEMQPGDMLILPNLRYFPGEEGNSPEFAAELANLAEVYVNDAFACDHRAHASIVGIPAILPSGAGYLVENEVKQLGSLLKKPRTPFIVIMGGAKVSDKIEVIRSLAKVADHILVGGAMANTFLLAKGENIGQSLAEADKLQLAKDLIGELGEKLVLAPDYIKDNPESEDFKYLDIGEESIALFKTYLQDAGTIFWNGSLGFTVDEKFAKATNEIAEYISQLPDATSVVAGGDTVETVSSLGIHDKYTFVSTGGGAALEFLAGDVLPGIKALEAKK